MANILFCHSMEGMKEVWRQILEESGHSVATAKNMQEAYDHLSDKKKQFDLVVTHLHFDGKQDGTAAMWLCEKAITKFQTKVALLSANPGEAARLLRAASWGSRAQQMGLTLLLDLNHDHSYTTFVTNMFLAV